jgi:hypothetical protein
MIWNEETDSVLVKLWDETGSLQAVADGMCELGFINVTRSMVSGRRHRLPKEAFKRQLSAHILEQARPKPPRLRRKTMMTVIPKVPNHDIPLSENRGADYLASRAWQCKAVLDVRSTSEESWGLRKVCGLPRLNGSPYCRQHGELYRNPTT